MSFRVDGYNSYHNIADWTHPYSALSSCTYSNFWSFFITINYAMDWSISQKIFTSFPVIFRSTSSFFLKCRQAYFISVIVLPLTSIASIILVRKNASCETVGDAVSSFLYDPCCTFPLKTIFPFMTGFLGVCPLLIFYLIRLIMFSAFFLWS